MNSVLRTRCVAVTAIMFAVAFILLVLAPATAMSQTCSCPNQGDLDGDGFGTSLDLSDALDFLFFEGPLSTDPDCPVSRLDVDCDGIHTTIDLEILISILFAGGTPCDPCDCPGTPPVCEPDFQSSGSVVVESKTVLPGQPNVEVGIYLANPVDIGHLNFPLEIRQTSGSAFPSGEIVVERAGRLAGTGLTESTGYYSDPQIGNVCSGPVSSSYSNKEVSPFIASEPIDGIRYTTYRVGGGSCLSAGSDGAPGSGNPSVKITFDVGIGEGTFEIDTCCATPSHHLLFANCSGDQLYLPDFTRGVITVGQPQACDQTTTDSYLLACPRGDIPFTVQLIDQDGLPMAGYSDVTLDFSDCDPAEFFPQPGLYPSWPIVNAPLPADDNGIIEFRIVAGGDCPDCSVTVSTGCGFSRTVPARSTDVDGDAWVTPADFDDALGLCRDLNADGIINDLDYQRHLAHCCDHKFPDGPCDLLTQTIRLDPDGGFEPFDMIDVFWELENNEAGDPCTVDSVQLYQSEWTPVPVWEHVSTWIRGATVTPGDIDRDSLEYTVPDFGKMCLRTLLYTDCCTTPQEEVACVDVIRQCPPDAVCFEFRTLDLAAADEYFATSTIPYALGWTVDTVLVVDTMVTTICTSDITPAGTAGSLTFFYRVGEVWRDFTYRVVQELFKGDMSGDETPGKPDCILNTVDLNFLIQQIFFNGPAPFPEEASDLNCDGVPDVVDLNILIKVLFFNMPPPPVCGDGPGI